MAQMHKLIISVLVACLASGCSLSYRQPIYQGNLLSSDEVGQLQVGMNRLQVSALLGTPSIQDPFHHDRWDYTSTRRVGRTGGTEVRNLVLYFEGDALARWEGEHFPDQDQELIKDVRRQFGPNLPREQNRRGRR